MAKRDILLAPDPLLKTRAEPVAEITGEVTDLLADMLETMYAADGIGLAANQIGIARRLMVVDVGRPDAEGARVPDPLKLVNPEILWADEEIELAEEGCLSLPELTAEVPRPRAVRVGYLDESGAAREIDAQGMLARCLQHEIDHIDGVLFCDRLSRLKRDMMMRKARKIKQERTRAAADGDKAAS